MANISRRAFLKGAAASAAGAAALGVLGTAAAAETNDVMTAELAKKQWGFEIPPEPVAQSEIVESFTAQVVVVGAGTAGLMAANSCIDQGLSVILISASSVPCCRGGSNCASYSKAMEAAGIPKVSPWIVQKEIMANYNAVDQRKWYKWYNDSPEAFDWVIDIMEAKGYYTAIEQNNHMKEDNIYYQPLCSHSWVPDISSNTVSMNQTELLAVFEARLLEKSGQIFYRNAGYQLIREDSGRVDGVIARRLDDAGYNQFTATKAVIIAAGDFSADREMMMKYAPEYAGYVADAVYDAEQSYDLQMATGGLFKGDMHKAALWIGAAWQKTLPNCPMVGTFSGGATVNRYQNFFGLLVDADGERFMNEYESRSLGPMTQFMQKNGCTWAIWDIDWAKHFKWYDLAYAEQYKEESCRSEETIIEGWNDRVDQVNYVKADTIEELLETVGLPASAADTIERYNQMCDAGEDTEFYKDPDFLIPVRTGPFYCHKVDHSTVRFYTILGGLRTNADMQVCDEGDIPIPGLYNVGTGVGDVFAGKYTFMMQGGNYGINCITFPYLTGKFIAENE